MKKPSKEPQMLKRLDNIDLLNGDDGIYSANQIEEIAQQMRELGIARIELSSIFEYCNI